MTEFPDALKHGIKLYILEEATSCGLVESVTATEQVSGEFGELHDI